MYFTEKATPKRCKLLLPGTCKIYIYFVTRYVTTVAGAERRQIVRQSGTNIGFNEHFHVLSRL
jgi:hypothetical protein